MSQVLSAFGNALRDLREPGILAIALLPMLGALAIWAALSWIFWDHWTAAINGLAAETAAGRWLENLGIGWITRALAALGVIVLLAPATLISAVLITEIVAMPAIIAFVGGRYYAGLVKKAGGTVAGSASNAIVGVAVFCLLWLVTLPLWLTGVAALVLPLLLSAYLNQRLFCYDALADHASRDEYRRILADGRARLYALGLLLAVLYYVPLVNLLVPVLCALAYTHFCLGELVRLRAGRGEEKGETREA